MEVAPNHPNHAKCENWRPWFWGFIWIHHFENPPCGNKNHEIDILIKGSWEAILPCYEWLLLWWRVVREWDLILMQLTMMKGGVRVRLDLDAIDYDEGWCASETWSWCNWLWCRVVCEWDLILMQLTMMKGGVRVRLDLDAIDYDEGWCASETWSWWNWLWWRVVSGEEGKWWGREVVRKGGSRSTKPCVFPCKVAAGDDERYLVCATGGAAVVSVRELFLLCVLQRVVVSVCVVLCGSWISGCRLHWNGCMNVAWAMLWRGSRSTKPCVSCKVAAGDDERYLVCATGAAAVVSVANCSSYVFCNEWLCLCA